MTAFTGAREGSNVKQACNKRLLAIHFNLLTEEVILVKANEKKMKGRSYDILLAPEYRLASDTK